MGKKKTAYVIWSGSLRPDYATKIRYPEAMEFNGWAHGLLEGSRIMREEFGGAILLNVVSDDELINSSAVSACDRAAIKNLLAGA